MQIISRKDALAAGLPHYFTGVPCPNGHLVHRFTSAYTCSECAEMHKRGYRADPEFHAREMAYKAEYRDANREAINEYARRYWRDNPNSRIVSAQQKEKHKEYYKEYNRKYAADRPEYTKERSAKWRANNNEKVRAYIAARRARKKNAEGRYYEADIKLIFSEQDGLCSGCLDELKPGYHIDHVMPLILGGSNWPDNLQLLCASCNSRKNRVHPLDWFNTINKAYLA